jgi:hypothetical protein
MAVLGGVAFIGGAFATGGLDLPVGGVIWGGAVFGGTGLTLRYAGAAGVAACQR